MTPGTCAIEGCTSPARSRGWCSKHYQRWTKNGDPNAVAWTRGDPVSNFWAKVDRRGPGECWPWTGWLSKQGYGQYAQWDPDARRQRIFPAHRFAYELIVGPVPDGLVVDHQCHNRDTECSGGKDCPHRRCVNPAHLEPATTSENTSRGRTGELKAAEQLAKTHCPQGHPYDEVNTYVETKPNGRPGRKCRACQRERYPAYADLTPEQKERARTRAREYARRQRAKARASSENIE